MALPCCGGTVRYLWRDRTVAVYCLSVTKASVRSLYSYLHGRFMPNCVYLRKKKEKKERKKIQLYF